MSKKNSVIYNINTDDRSIEEPKFDPNSVNTSIEKFKNIY